jgi:hypothetical protein
MYVVNSSKWDNSRIEGQERLLADVWLEIVADDCSPTCWSPLFSVVQLIKNLVTVMEEIDAGKLSMYHMPHCCEELLARLKVGTWLDSVLREDVLFLKSKLAWVSKLDGDDAGDRRARTQVLSLLKSFVSKLERVKAWKQQVEHVAEQIAQVGTNFSANTRAIGELINDLMHEGHSRSHLDSWMLQEVVGRAGTESYCSAFATGPSLRKELTNFEVMFQVACPGSVSSSRNIRIANSIPTDWALKPESVFLQDTKTRFAVVQVSGVRDQHAAISKARSDLSRHLWSVTFHRISFERVVSNHAAVRQKVSDDHDHTIQPVAVTEERQPKLLEYDTLWNFKRLETIDTNTCNAQTMHALDRVLFWLEQSRRVDPMTALTTEWTALEFLLSGQGVRHLDAVVKYVPSYLAPRYPRLVLVDFWKYFLHIKPTLSDDFKKSIGCIDANHVKARATCDFSALLNVCLNDETPNEIEPLIRDYPLLISKWQRIRRLRPDQKSLHEDVLRFTQGIVFDLRTCYRARNTVVHDAAMTLTEHLRLLQRLNWVLCRCFDQAIYSFSRNPSLSVDDLHNCSEMSAEQWLKDVKDITNPCSLEHVVNPPNYFN